MNSNKEIPSTVIFRGGQKIDVEKEEKVFTAIVSRQEDIDALNAHKGVPSISNLVKGAVKVEVKPGEINQVMDDYRSNTENRICHHAYRPKGQEGTRYYLSDRINVRFQFGTDRKVIEKVLKSHGLNLIRSYKHLADTYLVQVTAASLKNPIKVSNDLASLETVAYAEPDMIERVSPSYIPHDNLFQYQWHLKSWNGPQLDHDADVSVEAAWDISRGSRDIVVAVLDDGFDLDHPDFKGPGKVVHPRDFVSGDSHPFPEKSAGDYHGTPCAGVALAEENGTGVVGAAPGVAFMPIRFPLSAADSDYVAIFDFVGERADVISCSWGPPPVYAQMSQALIDTFSVISRVGGPRRNGSVICFAAGNYNAPIDDSANVGFQWRHPHNGLRLTTGPIKNGYASHPDVIAVSSCTSEKRKAAYSNWGHEISVCAPSNNFHPLDPNAVVSGMGIVSTDNEKWGEGFTPNNQFTNRFGGTSSAAPLVAGVAALVRSANPQLTALEVKSILGETADKIEDRNPDPVLENEFGTYETGRRHSQWFGFGRVNAAAAVKRAVLFRGISDHPSFASDIRPKFRSRDINAMLLIAQLDLSSYQDVKTNAGEILQRLQSGSMPCDGAWPDEWVEIFSNWVNSGMAS